MKITELIKLLEASQAAHGDHEVYLEFPPDDPDGEAEVYGVRSHHLHQLTGRPMVTCISGVDPDEAD